MKPITEHPEFRAQVEKRFARIGINDPTGLACKAEYIESAKATQSILQKEHEVEMEEFAEWLQQKITNGTVYVYASKWVHYPVPNHGNVLTHYELLQLFRERDGK